MDHERLLTADQVAPRSVASWHLKVCAVTPRHVQQAVDNHPRLMHYKLLHG